MAPKSFRNINDPAAITRARSVGLKSKTPSSQVYPALIDRLEDTDPVVRLAAFEELRKDTGQTLGYRPWAGDGERSSAVSRWRSWWKQRQVGLSRFGRNP